MHPHKTNGQKRTVVDWSRGGKPKRSKSKSNPKPRRAKK